MGLQLTDFGITLTIYMSESESKVPKSQYSSRVVYLLITLLFINLEYSPYT